MQSKNRRDFDCEASELFSRNLSAGLLGEFGELPGEFGELPGEFGELPGDFEELPGEFGELLGDVGELTQQPTHYGAEA